MDVSWASDKALEIFQSGHDDVGQWLADIERAIREALEKAAEVASNGGDCCGCETDANTAAAAIRRLGSP